MPIKYWIETDKKRIRAEVTGDISNQDILQTINNSLDDPNFKKGFDILSDHTMISKHITTDQVKLTSHQIEINLDKMKGSRWAVVTTNQASYGMMRMLSVYLEGISMELQIFSSLDEAEDWLSSPKENLQ